MIHRAPSSRGERRAGTGAGRRGFTLVEVIVAGLIATIVLGSVSMSLGQLSRAKNSSRDRFSAHLRAHVALTAIRRDIVSTIRADDLFYTRFVLYDDQQATPLGDMDRDEVLVFNTRLRPVREMADFNGEGIEYETQYRVQSDDRGPMLWQRRDMVPDEYSSGGGQASPMVDGIVALSIEAYDGDEWFAEWDSDEHGLPLAVRIGVTASGNREGHDAYDAPIASLRTVVPIDRVIPPRDHLDALEEELMSQEIADAQDAATATLPPPSTGNDGGASGGGGDTGGGGGVTGSNGGAASIGGAGGGRSGGSRSTTGNNEDN